MYQKKSRTCLKCGQPFNSNGPWHRLCKTCKRDNSGKQSKEPASTHKQSRVIPKGLSE